MKNIEGHLQSVSYYREGNPNPYNFEDTNIGMTEKELDRFFAEDFYSIIVKIQPTTRAVYLLLMSVFNLMLCLLFMICVFIGEWVL